MKDLTHPAQMIYAGNRFEIRRFVSDGDPNALADRAEDVPSNTVRQCRSLLAFSASLNLVWAIDLLCEAGADVEFGGQQIGGPNPLPSYETPLAAAAEHGALEAVDALLRHGAKVDGTTPFDKAEMTGETPLIVAVERLVTGQLPEEKRAQYQQICVRLLEAGASPNATTRGNATPTRLAVAAGDATLVNTLVNNGANVNGKFDGITLLHLSAALHPKTIYPLLVKLGADESVIAERDVAFFFRGVEISIPAGARPSDLIA